MDSSTSAPSPLAPCPLVPHQTSSALNTTRAENSCTAPPSAIPISHLQHLLQGTPNHNANETQPASDPAVLVAGVRPFAAPFLPGIVPLQLHSEVAGRSLANPADLTSYQALLHGHSETFNTSIDGAHAPPLNYGDPDQSYCPQLGTSLISPTTAPGSTYFPQSPLDNPALLTNVAPLQADNTHHMHGMSLQTITPLVTSDSHHGHVRRHPWVPSDPARNPVHDGPSDQHIRSQQAQQQHHHPSSSRPR
jgi:hypothetical protein